MYIALVSSHPRALIPSPQVKSVAWSLHGSVCNPETFLSRLPDRLLFIVFLIDFFMTDNNSASGLAPQRQFTSLVRPPQAALPVLDNNHPPRNARALHEAIVLALEASGMSYLQHELCNIVAPDGVASDPDAPHVDFRGVLNTLGAVFDGENDAEVSFGSSPAVTVAKASTPFGGGGDSPYYLDHRVQGEQVEHPTARTARMTMYNYVSAAFATQRWILEGKNKGDIYSVLLALQRLHATTPVDDLTEAIMQAAGFAKDPSSSVDFPKLMTSFKMLQQVVARPRGPGFQVGDQVLIPLLLKALSKDKSLTTPLALFYQLKPMPSFAETVAYWMETTSRIGARTVTPGHSLLTYPAVVEERGLPAREQGGGYPQGFVKVCFAAQRGAYCPKGSKCEYSHDPEDIKHAPPPPPMRDPKPRRGVCAACGSHEHGVDKCPRNREATRRRAQATPAGYTGQAGVPDPLALSEAEVQQFRRLLADATPPQQPPVIGGSMAVLGVDDDLQAMLSNARDR